MHCSDCRLIGEVLPRLMAVAPSARWTRLTPAEALEAVDKLAGWASVHLAVVVEHGWDCPSEHRRTA